MIRTSTLLLIISVLGILLTNCSSGDEDLTVSRGITIINDEASLSDRLKQIQDTLEITGPEGGRVEKTFNLILETEISSPEVDGKSLQAAAINSSGGNIFVCYNYAGSEYLGGVDFINDQLKLKASIQYNDSDINSVAFGKGNVYLVGATALDSPAFVEKVKFADFGFSLDNHSRTFLGSYTSTSVTFFDSEVYVTTGNDEVLGGGLYQLDENLSILNHTALHDARWVMESEGIVLVAQGTPGKITSLDAASFEQTGSFRFNGANIAEAKTTIDIEDDRIFIAGGQAGVQVFNFKTGDFLYEIALEEDNAVTNAVTAENGLIFISNGPNVYVASYDSKKMSVQPELLGKIEFKVGISANHVLYRSNKMYIASGNGGVKVVKVVD